jgi:hypothetical protein
MRLCKTIELRLSHINNGIYGIQCISMIQAEGRRPLRQILSALTGCFYLSTLKNIGIFIGNSLYQPNGLMTDKRLAQRISWISAQQVVFLIHFFALHAHE